MKHMLHQRRSGFTIVELMVYMMMGGLILTAIISVYMMGSSSYGSAQAGFQVVQGVQSAARRLRSDLHDTSLSTVRVFPAPLGGPIIPDVNDTQPGLSLESPRKPGEAGGPLKMSPFGTVLWQKYVAYTLVRSQTLTFYDTFNNQGISVDVGNLMRFEPTATGGTAVPQASAVIPSTVVPGTAQAVLHNVIMPHQSFPDVLPDSGDQGGFAVGFVRLDQPDPSPFNPALIQDKGGKYTTSGNTELIQVTLRVLDLSVRTNKPSYYTQTFKIKPRN